MKDYQLDYAANRPQMYDAVSRERKAYRMVKALEYHFGKDKLKRLNLLDIGSSTGIIDNYLADYFKKVTGTDIDEQGVKFAQQRFKKPNLVFQTADAMKLSFKDDTFDIVICTHIYEHVPSAKQLFKEIERVLKPGGVCYLAALNKWWPIEPHYNLPFLSWLPKSMANIYLRTLSKGNVYYETLESRSGLRKLAKNFRIIELTAKVLANPELFGYEDILKGLSRKTLGKILSPAAKYMAPTFFWLLIKKG